MDSFIPSLSSTNTPLLLPPPTNTTHIVPHVNPANLPDEVLLCIFQRLTHVRHIATARSVCNTWRSLIDRTAFIWRSLILELPKSPAYAKHAETWYRKAAEYGNSQAQVCLILCNIYKS